MCYVTINFVVHTLLVRTIQARAAVALRVVRILSFLGRYDFWTLDFEGSWCFYLTWRPEKLDAGITATEWSVILLLGILYELHNKNMILALDNWYTSIPVALYLMGIGIHLVGTCEANLKFIKKKAILPKVGERGYVRGFEGAVTKDGTTLRNKIYVTGLRDNKPALMLHIQCQSTTKCQRKSELNSSCREDSNQCTE